MDTIWKKDRFKALTKKHQAYFIILAFSVFLIPLFINISINSLLAESYNSPNALMFQEYTLKYEYYNNTETANITIKTEPVEDQSDYTNVNVDFEQQDINFEAHPRRGYLKGTKRFPIFWIGKNPYESLVGQKIEIVDVLGILGEIDKIYELDFKIRELYWNENPHFLGLQIINIIDILNEDDEVIAEGIVDDDSGLVMKIKGDGIEFILTDRGDFPITLDAIYSIYIAIGLMITIPFVLFLYNRKNHKEDSINILLLSIMGAVAVFTDFIYDVWFYAILPIEFVILIHLGIMICIGLICYYHRAIKFLFPSLLEFGFIILLFLLVGGSYFPALTLISGSTITFIGLIFYSEKE